MKLNYENLEDAYWLEKIILRAILGTENVMDPFFSQLELREYRTKVLELRKKCFEFLEEGDPNKPLVEMLLKDCPKDET